MKKIFLLIVAIFSSFFLDQSLAFSDVSEVDIEKLSHHKNRLKFYSGDIHHRVAGDYLVGVRSGEKRHGLFENMSISVTSNIRSLYVSKELPDSKGPVWQPSFTFELYHVGVNVWSNFVLNNEANQGEFNEVDLSLYYTGKIGNLTIHPYLLGMVFPNGDPDSLDYTSQPVLETDLFLRYDIWKFNLFSLTRTQVKGSSPGAVYSHFGVGFNHGFDCGISLETSARLSFGNDIFLSSHYGNMGTNIDAVAFLLAASWKPWKGLSFTPHANVAIHLPPSIRRAMRQNPDLHTYLVWGGLDLKYDF